MYPLLTQVCTSKGGYDIKGAFVELSLSFLLMCVFLNAWSARFIPLLVTLRLSFQQTDFSTCSSMKGIHALLPLIKVYSTVSCLYQHRTISAFSITYQTISVAEVSPIHKKQINL